MFKRLITDDGAALQRVCDLTRRVRDALQRVRDVAAMTRRVCDLMMQRCSGGACVELERCCLHVLFVPAPNNALQRFVAVEVVK